MWEVGQAGHWLVAGCLWMVSMQGSLGPGRCNKQC